MSAQQNSLFEELYPAASSRRALVLFVSVAVHCCFLVWLLHAPAPVFLSPSYVVRGERTGSAQVLYFPSHWNPDQTDASVSGANRTRHDMAAQARITWTRSRNIGKTHDREIALSKTTETGIRASGGSNPAPPLGSPYGSVSEGVTSGFDIRPALWASGSDPLISPGELAGLEGNVIVEITIDEQGSVVHTAVLQSLTPVIDAKVVAALQNWHFHPATRDGIAVASKQDVYYHFPVRR